MSTINKPAIILSQISASYRDISRINLIYWTNRIVFLAIAVAGLIISWAYKRLPPQIPLWYSLPWGNDRLAEPFYLFTPLIITGLAHLINLFISVTLLKPYATFIRMLMISSIFVSVLSLMVILNILNLVF